MQRRRSRRSRVYREREMGAGEGWEVGDEREGKERIECSTGGDPYRQIDKSLIPSTRFSRPGAISRYRLTGQLGPHLFSIPPLLFARHTCHRSRSTPSLPPLTSTLLSPPLSLQTRLLFSAAMSRRCSFLLPYPLFCHSNPTCVRLFPHVVLIILCLFHFSAFRSDRRGFHLTPYPLICAAM
jgi:hypothetical protein